MSTFKPPSFDCMFGQPSVAKVTAEVAVGDVERSAEAKEIVQLVTTQSLMTAAHSSKAVLLYSKSLIARIKSINDESMRQACAAEKEVRDQTKTLFASITRIFNKPFRKIPDNNDGLIP